MANKIVCECTAQSIGAKYVVRDLKIKINHQNRKARFFNFPISTIYYCWSPTVLCLPYYFPDWIEFTIRKTFPLHEMRYRWIRTWIIFGNHSSLFSFGSNFWHQSILLVVFVCYLFMFVVNSSGEYAKKKVSFHPNSWKFILFDSSACTVMKIGKKIILKWTVAVNR